MLRVMILIALLSKIACRKSLKNGHMTEECSCPQGQTMALIKDNRFHCFDRCDICPNGFCSKKVLCHCFHNMQKDARGICPQICPNCKNGWCSSPFKCECNEGFAGDGCLPVCSSGCPNGYCSAPGRCTCDTGYERSAVGECEPISLNRCPNGYCSAPGVCVCNAGYAMSPVMKWSLFALPLVLLLVCGLFAVKYVCKASRPPRTRTSSQVVDVMRCPPPDGQSQVPLTVFILN